MQTAEMGRNTILGQPGLGKRLGVVVQICNLTNGRKSGWSRQRKILEAVAHISNSSYLEVEIWRFVVRSQLGK
jgi:hypothetical protein